MGPWTIAHRGGALLRAENTLAAFADAVRCGCDGAELDVQLSRDGEVVVHHDLRLKPALTRGADGNWLKPPTPRLKDLTLAELRAFDVGRADPSSGYAASHARTVWQDDECIPLLEEVIAVAKTAPKRFLLFVELKSAFPDRDEGADPETLAEKTLAVLQERRYLDNTVFVGFDWRGLVHLKKNAPDAQCWFTTLPVSWFKEGTPPPEHDPPSEPLLSNYRRWAREGTSPWAAGHDAIRHGGSLVRAAKAAGADGWNPMWVDVNEDSVREARELGLKIGTWTVDNPDELRWLASLGVDAICTDRPDVMLKIASSE